jgi:hypothetical protein
MHNTRRKSQTALFFDGEALAAELMCRHRTTDKGFMQSSIVPPRPHSPIDRNNTASTMIDTSYRASFLMFDISF